MSPYFCAFCARRICAFCARRISAEEMNERDDCPNCGATKVRLTLGAGKSPKSAECTHNAESRR